MNPSHGSNGNGIKNPGMCWLHVDDLFVITATPEFLEKFQKIKSNLKIGHEDVNDLSFTGRRVRWQFHEESDIVVEQSLCVSELTEIMIPKGHKAAEKCDKDMHTAYRSFLEAQIARSHDFFNPNAAWV